MPKFQLLRWRNQSTMGVAMIRVPEDADFAAIADITNHYIVSSAIHFAYEPFTEAEMRDMWHGYRDRFPWLVAADGGRVIGYAKASTWRGRTAYDWTAEIGLYVAHDVRGRGTGRALYGALLEELTRRGFRSAIAGVTLPNDASLALHRAFGFASVGVVRDAGFKHGRWHDVEFFQKRFASDDTVPGA
jgi:phosphinothricin acetyltransferase